MVAACPRPCRGIRMGLHPRTCCGHSRAGNGRSSSWHCRPRSGCRNGGISSAALASVWLGSVFPITAALPLAMALRRAFGEIPHDVPGFVQVVFSIAHRQPKKKHGLPCSKGRAVLSLINKVLPIQVLSGLGQVSRDDRAWPEAHQQGARDGAPCCR